MVGGACQTVRVPPTAPVPRRTVFRLAGAGAGAAWMGALAGCIPGSAREPRRDPVVESLGLVWAGEEALVARYRQVIGRHPALGSRLAGALADHVAHAAAVRSLLDARRSPAPSPSASASGRPHTRPVPATAAAALADLAGAETAAATAATAACLAADGDTAALLASVAACETSHLVVIR